MIISCEILISPFSHPRHLFFIFLAGTHSFPFSDAEAKAEPSSLTKSKEKHFSLCFFCAIETK